MSLTSLRIGYVAQSQVICGKCKASKPRGRETRRDGTTQISCKLYPYCSYLVYKSQIDERQVDI
jgi:ssDNA-binding Zn-finger/Zn-ribbon topoisomerase 1